LHKFNLVIAEAVAYTKAIQKEKEAREMKKLLPKKTSTVEVSTFMAMYITTSLLVYLVT